MKMTSQESQTIRAGFVNDAESLDVPLETQRREWEEAAARAQLPPGVTVESVLADGIACEKVSSAGADPSRLLFHIHGGGFTSGSCVTHRELAAHLSLATGIPVLLPDYRLAPEHPFPAALDDCVSVYRWLLRTGIDPKRIVFGGDSAGGGLALSTLLCLREGGEPLPAAAILLSPWTDLTLTGESLVLRAQLDPLNSHQGLQTAADLYVNDEDPTNPLISPVHAELRGLPPMLIQVGDHEILLSDSTRLAGRAEAAGIETQLEIWPEMWHVWHFWAAGLPEARQALDGVGRYARQKLYSV